MRPFIRVHVALVRFGRSAVVDMMVDSGADLTTLQPRDSSRLLKEADFRLLGGLRMVQGLGGLVECYAEEGAVGFFMPGRQICWVPTLIDVIKPESGSPLPSALGNDVLQFGVTTLDQRRGVVTIELFLKSPLITRY